MISDPVSGRPNGATGVSDMAGKAAKGSGRAQRERPRYKAALCIRGKFAITFLSETPPKERNYGHVYQSLQFTDQGIRNVKDATKRAAAATAEAEKMGVKVTDSFWTMGAYDVVLVLDAPDDATVTAFSVKLGSLGNVKPQTMRAFRREEMEKILAKIK